MQGGQTQSNTSTNLSTTAPSELSDKALVQLMADDDKRALKLLYVRHHDRVRRFVALVRAAGAPCYALGGVNGRTVNSLSGSGAVGVAAVGALATAGTRPARI